MSRLLQRTPPIAAGLAVGSILGLPFLWFLAVRLLTLAGTPMRDQTGADMVAALWPPATLVASAVWGLWLGIRCGRPSPWAGALAAVLGLGVVLHAVALGWAHDPIVRLLRAASPNPSASTVVGLEMAATAGICAATTGLLLGMAARDLKATLVLGTVGMAIAAPMWVLILLLQGTGIVVGDGSGNMARVAAAAIVLGSVIASVAFARILGRGQPSPTDGASPRAASATAGEL